MKLSEIYLTYDLRSVMRQELFTPLLRNGIKYRDLRVDFVIGQFKGCGLDEEFTSQFVGEVVRVYKNQNQNHE